MQSLESRFEVRNRDFDLAVQTHSRESKSCRCFILREHYLSPEGFKKRLRKTGNGLKESEKWANQFSDLEKLHAENWNIDLTAEADTKYAGDEAGELSDDDGYDPIKMLRQNTKIE